MGEWPSPYPEQQQNRDAPDAQQSVGVPNFVKVVDDVGPHLNKCVAFDVLADAQQVFHLAGHNDQGHRWGKPWGHWPWHKVNHKT